MNVTVPLTEEEVEALKAAMEDWNSRLGFRALTGAEMAAFLLRDSLITLGFLKLPNENRSQGARRS